MFDRAVFLDAVRFWETGRLGYNGVLALVLLIVASYGDAWETIAKEFGLVIGLGVMANCSTASLIRLTSSFRPRPRARFGGSGDGSLGVRERGSRRCSRSA
jgi:hypothetical protein